MDQSTREVRLANWASIIDQCQHRPAGMTIEAWCEQNGLSIKTYYYRQRQVRKAAYDKIAHAGDLPAAPHETSGSPVTFAEIPVSMQEYPANAGISGFTPDAVLQTGHVSIALSNTASPQLIRQIMEAAADVK